ncbi:MAG: hypothetical protein EOM65_16575 [Synergistales bacterium]|nr:hypothetical protein [Synergistales bacterium]
MCRAKQICTVEKILFSLFLIAFGLLMGFAARFLDKKGALQLPWPIQKVRTFLQKSVLLGIGPVTFAGALWVVEISEPRIALLALIGPFCHVFGGLGGAVLARIFRMAPAQAGSMFCCGFFTNIGSIGGLITFVFLGEKGYAFVAVFKLIEELVYYGIGFPAVRLYSAQEKAGSTRSLVQQLIRDPFLLVSLGSLFTGTCLNLSGIPRPPFFSLLNTVLIPLSTVILLTTIGMAMSFGKTGRYLKESLAISGVKFLLVPAACTSPAGPRRCMPNCRRSPKRRARPRPPASETGLPARIFRTD